MENGGRGGEGRAVRGGGERGEGRGVCVFEWRWGGGKVCTLQTLRWGRSNKATRQEWGSDLLGDYSVY